MGDKRVRTAAEEVLDKLNRNKNNFYSHIYKTTPMLIYPAMATLPTKESTDLRKLYQKCRILI